MKGNIMGKQKLTELMIWKAKSQQKYMMPMKYTLYKVKVKLLLNFRIILKKHHPPLEVLSCFPITYLLCSIFNSNTQSHQSPQVESLQNLS